MTTYGWYSAVAIIVLTSLIAFFAPIYGIHREMLRQRLHYQQRLDKLTRQLDSVSRGLLDSDRVNGSTDTQTQLATLKELRDVYQTSNYFPVWPFNRNTLMKLTVSQVVPLLSLTGIGKPILDIVGNLLGQLSAK